MCKTSEIIAAPANVIMSRYDTCNAFGVLKHPVTKEFIKIYLTIFLTLTSHNISSSVVFINKDIIIRNIHITFYIF